MSECLADVAAWMRSNRLQLNTAKTEVIWCSSTRRQHQIPQSPLVVSSDAVVLVCVARDLGIYLDSDLMMRTHVAKTVSSCFAVLIQLRSIRRSVSDPVLQSLVVALVLTKVDYSSATLAGLPAVQLDRLQSVLNAAARLIYRRRKFDHVSPLLKELIWLRVPQRITFRLAVLGYRCQLNMAPRYLTAQIQQASSVGYRQRLGSSSSSSAKLDVPRTEHVTIGGRTFSSTAAHVWNSLPTAVQSSESLDIFRRRLKTELFERSYNSVKQLYCCVTHFHLPAAFCCGRNLEVYRL